jgi:hypothetical protein
MLALGMSNAGCGDDDDSGTDAGPDGSVDGSIGSGGSGSAGNGGKDAGSDSGTTTGGTGGRMSGGTGGAGNIPVPMCDTSIPTTATCGGTECAPPSSQLAAFTCSVPCCLPDDTCGLRRAVMDKVSDCAPAGVEDPSCPGYMGMGPAFGGGGGNRPDAGNASDGGDAGANPYPPCCAPSGHCGIISSIDGLCITESQILTDLMPGPACGESNDGGMDGGS